MAHDREIAGIRCTELLSELSDYEAGALPPARVAQIRAHLRGCHWCDDFGGAFADMVQRLRAELGPPEPPNQGEIEALLASLDLEP